VTDNVLFDLPGAPAAAPRGPLTREEAVRLYVSGLSVCQIRELYPRMKRSGVEARIRAGGRGGLVWCPVCRRLEELSLPDGPAR
jgi:hypothetical protein